MTVETRARWQVWTNPGQLQGEISSLLKVFPQGDERPEMASYPGAENTHRLACRAGALHFVRRPVPRRGQQAAAQNHLPPPPLAGGPPSLGVVPGMPEQEGELAELPLTVVLRRPPLALFKAATSPPPTALQTAREWRETTRPGCPRCADAAPADPSCLRRASCGSYDQGAIGQKCIFSLPGPSPIQGRGLAAPRRRAPPSTL
ncbi:MAG: hypothetical protein FD153_670 [Rhodospirillaceae bacterium]|nr:MAG: hypothetical protein FD153_670 [Rhodospirillaceae bacterium]